MPGPTSLRAQRQRLLAPRVPVGGLLLVLALALGTTFPYFEAIRSANELPRLMQGIAIVDDHSLAIDGPRRRGLDAGPDTSRGVDGLAYPNKPPLTSLVAAAGYVAAKATATESPTLRGYTWWARLFGALLPTLVLCGWAWQRYAPREGTNPARLGILLYAVASPAASYAHLLYSHQLAACLATIGAAWCIDGVREASMRRGAAGGALAALAVVAEYQAVVLALPLGLVLLGTLRTPSARPAVLSSVAAAATVIAALAGYHHVAFGSPLATGYHHAQNVGFAAKHAVGVLGMSVPTWEGFYTHVLSPAHGLWWWIPLFPLAVYGLAQLALLDDARALEARVALGFFVVLLVVGCGLSFDGGWRVGPRYLMVAAPALMLGWAHAFRQLSTSWLAMSIAMFFGVWSAVQNGLAASLWPHIDAENLHYPLADVLVPLFRHDHQPYGVAWFLGSELGVLAAVGIGTLAVVSAVLRTSELGIRMTWASTVAVVAALYGVALTPTLTPEHPMAARNLAYVERVYEPRTGSLEPGPSVIIAAPSNRRARP